MMRLPPKKLIQSKRKSLIFLSNLLSIQQLQITLEIAQKQLLDYQAMKGKLEINELKLKKLQKQNAKLREKYNYKLWNSVDLIDWIMSLENGRYKKYEEKMSEYILKS